jgi:hypothetical protein
LLIAADTDRVKRALRIAHGFLRDPDQMKGSEFEAMPDFPLRKIVDTPHFAERSDSAPLQVADVCAFLIMRRLMRPAGITAIFRDYCSTAFLARR